MAPHLETISRGRVQFESKLTRAEIQSLVDDPQLKILQTRRAVEPSTWTLLNDVLFKARPDVQLRVFGFYSEECDLSFLRCLTNLRHFSADSILRAKGIQFIGQRTELQSLGVDIYNLENFDFLEELPNHGLRVLSLGATKSKRPTLRLIKRFKNLRTLYLDGQQKEIDVISQLPLLEDLTLRSVTVENLEFLRNLDHLWSLDIKLGGTNNISALAGMSGIKYLELWQIRGLKDISPISTMHGLQYLFLQNLPHIATIPDLSELRALRKIYLEDLKGLKDITALAKAPLLEELLHVSAQTMQPTDYADLLKSKTLRQILVGFGSKRKNKEFLDLVIAAGLKEFERSEFSFK